MKLYMKSNLPEESYFKAMTACAIRMRKKVSTKVVIIFFTTLVVMILFEIVYANSIVRA